MLDAAPPKNQSVNLRIAGRVRALRAERRLSLEALAARSEVSRSMISLIERGESSPTAVVLDKLATALGVALVTLFEDTSRPLNPLSRREDRVTWRDPASGYERCNISPEVPSPFRIVEVVMPVGARVAYETGAREVTLQQQVWVQEGRLEVTVGEITHALAEDDCLAMNLNAPITFRNPDNQPTRYLVVVSSAD